MAKMSELVFVGDRSSSMESMGDSPWKGAMEWANTQAGEANANGRDAYITLVTFDDVSERVLDAVSTKDWKPIEISQMKDWFSPRGCTRLYDTVIEELDNLNKRIEIKGSDCRGVFAVFTDGEDNVSEADNADMNRAVTNARRNGVSCFFLAANQDAIASGLKYGFDDNQCLTTGTDPSSSANAYEAMSSAFSRTLCTSSTSTFSPDERATSAPLCSTRRKLPKRYRQKRPSESLQ